MLRYYSMLFYTDTLQQLAPDYASGSGAPAPLSVIGFQMGSGQTRLLFLEVPYVAIGLPHTVSYKLLSRE